RAGAGLIVTQGIFHRLMIELVLSHSRTGSLTVLVVGTAYQDGWFISAWMPTDNTRLIAFKHFGKGRRLPRFEPFPRPVQVNANLATTASSDDQIIPTITINIEPGYPRTQLT